MSDTSYTPYNPLDKRSIAASVVRELLDRPCEPLPPTAFYGVGIYAIYYHGSFDSYHAIAAPNASTCVAPIYVGKAIPRGGRKGVKVDAGEHSQALVERLRKHAHSIREASNLELADFRCRYLAVDELFIEMSERTLIQRFKPLWNACLGGFGNNDPGKGRYEGKRSGWDEVHPGRSWAHKLTPSELTAEQWLARVAQYLADLRAGTLGEVNVVDEEGEEGSN